MNAEQAKKVFKCNNPTKAFLLDSGLFTQVEPEYLAEINGHATLVNRSRGVVAIVDYYEVDSPTNNIYACARMFFDCGGTTYYSSGWYNIEELTKWVLPVMRSDRAWKFYESLNDRERDLTLALDYI